MKRQHLIVGVLGLTAVLGAVYWLIHKCRHEKVSFEGIAIENLMVADERRQNKDDMFTDVELLVRHYDGVGQYWMSVLDDKTCSIERRARAANILGLMKYTPAIPVLIKNVGVTDGSLGMAYNMDGADDGKFKVAVTALSNCSKHGLPEIVAAYLASTPSGQRLALIEATSPKEALTYMEGLYAQRDPRVTHEVLEAFRKDCRLLGCE